MSSTGTGVRPQPWRFLREQKPPSPELQRQLTLECAAARVLHRVAFLRSPQIPEPILEVTRRIHIRATAPIPPRRYIEIALALCKEDSDGVSCEAAIAWLEQRIPGHPEFVPILEQAKATRARWHRARSAVIRHNLRLAAAFVMKLYGRSQMPAEDLFQEAVFGLSKSADRFDPNYGVKFSTYSVWWIRHAIQRAMQNTMRLVRIPAHASDELCRYNNALRELGEDASAEEIAACGNLEIRRIPKLALIRKSTSVISLDAPMHGDATTLTPMVECLEADQLDLDAHMLRAERARIADRLLGDLPIRTRRILSMRCGLTGDAMTLVAIGEEMGLSRERVRQIESGVLSQLSTSAERALCTTSRA